MKRLTLFLCMLLLLLLSVSCKDVLQPDIPSQVELDITDQVEPDNTEADHEKQLQPHRSEDLEVGVDYAIVEDGDLQIKVDDLTTVLEINALPDSEIRQDDYQRILLLTDPSDQYQHGILGDDLEAMSVTIVQLSDQPDVISKFSVPEGWVIESIGPIWSDWDGDGEREILLTLSNSISGSKLVLYDEGGNILAESSPIGKGFRWRHALAIEAFGENGQRLLVDVQTPHIGGNVSFYSWNKEKKLIEIEASLLGYSTHDIGSRDMEMYALIKDEQSEQVLLIIPSQSKTEIAALRLVSGVIKEVWRIPLGGKLSGNLELIEENGVETIRTIVDNNLEVLLNIPE